MPKYTTFEETPAWQEAARLYHLVLDLVEKHGTSLSPGFRNQLDRAALAVSNCIAEAFDRREAELQDCLGTARQAASDVRSMCLVLERRPGLAATAASLREISTSAESCVRQTCGWMNAALSGGASRGPKPSVASDTREAPNLAGSKLRGT